MQARTVGLGLGQYAPAKVAYGGWQMVGAMSQSLYRVSAWKAHGQYLELPFVYSAPWLQA